MVAAASTRLSDPPVSVDGVAEGPAPPEIVRFRRAGMPGDYYQALGVAAQVRLRMLSTLHLRTSLGGAPPTAAALRRIEAQQHQLWQQLQWVVAEMRRLDAAGAAGVALGCDVPGPRRT